MNWGVTVEASLIERMVAEESRIGARPTTDQVLVLGLVELAKNELAALDVDSRTKS